MAAKRSMKKRRPIRPNKLVASDRSAIMSPLTAAMIALSMGRATSEHYHSLAGAILIADTIAGMVQRHRHLQSKLQPARDALNAIFDRQKQRTIPDAPWNGTTQEIDDLELGVKIYEALIQTTPAKTLARAMRRTLRDIETSEERA